MICDSMISFQRYKALAPEVWEKLSDFFTTISGTIPEPGTHLLDGEKLKVSVLHVATQPEECGKYEAHRQYIDIHIPIRGNETIICRCDSSDLKQTTSFDPAADCVFFERAPGVEYALEPGYFLMLYPGEAHHVLTGDGSTIVKLVVKIDRSLLQ